MIETCRTLGTTQGGRFRAFYGCMYYSMMRPSEVVALTLSACELPEDGWGWLTIADASTTAGRAYTDDGLTHEHRGLKGRTRAGRTPGRASRPGASRPSGASGHAARAHRPLRFRPGRAHFPFRARQPDPAVHLVAGLAESPARLAHRGELDGPLMRRPYGLRHAGVTQRLNEGVDQATVAAWAGHSVEVLRRIYHHSGRRPGRGSDRADGRPPEAVIRGGGAAGHILGTEFGIGRHRLASRVIRWHHRGSRRRR